MGAFLAFVGLIALCWAIFAIPSRKIDLRLTVAGAAVLLIAIGIVASRDGSAVWMFLFGIGVTSAGMWKRGYRVAGIGVGLVLCMIAAFILGEQPATNAEASGVSSRAASPHRPPPTPESVLAQKHDFLQTVDESISGAMIAGNPYKYVGDNVDLHCTVQNVPDPHLFNASCGTAIIVIKYDDTSDLDQGQAVRVMGTVVDPIEGNNLLGGNMKFPTVDAHFME